MTATGRRYVPEQIREIDRPHTGRSADDPLWLMGPSAGPTRDRVYRIAGCLTDRIRLFEGNLSAAQGWLILALHGT